MMTYCVGYKSGDGGVFHTELWLPARGAARSHTALMRRGRRRLLTRTNGVLGGSPRLPVLGERDSYRYIHIHMAAF